MAGALNAAVRMGNPRWQRHNGMRQDEAAEEHRGKAPTRGRRRSMTRRTRWGSMGTDVGRAAGYRARCVGQMVRSIVSLARISAPAVTSRAATGNVADLPYERALAAPDVIPDGAAVVALTGGGIGSVGVWRELLATTHAAAGSQWESWGTAGRATWAAPGRCGRDARSGSERRGLAALQRQCRSTR